jgi:hypothetical protein
MERRLRGRADDQSDFMGQRKFRILLRVGGPQHLIVADQQFFTKSALRLVQTYILVQVVPPRCDKPCCLANP